MTQDQEYPEAISVREHAAAESRLDDLTRLCELSRDLLFVLDREGRFIHANPATLDILGFAPAEIHGRRFLEGVSPGARARVTLHLARLEVESGPLVFDAPYRAKSGAYIELEWTVNGSRQRIQGVGHRRHSGDAPSHPISVSAHKTDAAGHAKTEFLASMNHELRTPLNAILGYTELLSSESGLSGRQREALQAIQRSSQHLLLLINDILDFAKLDAGKLTLQAREFSTAKFLRTLTELFEARAHEKHISFTHQQVTPLPEVICADETRLRQVLLNLCSNAVKFTHKGGVMLRIGFADGRLHFQVEDTGIGIPPAHLEAIFRPFEQIPHERGFVEGTGLGLSISRRLVDLMGGTLSVESQVGRGSTFAFAIEPEGVSPASVESLTPAPGAEPDGRAPGVPARNAGPAHAKNASVKAPCCFTPEQLRAIHDAATIGDIRAILSIIEHAGYRDDDPAQADSLAAELYRLAKTFRSKQIKERIQVLSP